MTEHDKVSSDVEATVGSEQGAMPSTGRRKLMKGVVLAAPAILMVRSGYSRPLASFGAEAEAEGIRRICTSIEAGPGFNPGEITPTLTSFYGGTPTTTGTFQKQYPNACKWPK